jgi:RimJ/RimL family protein N-acetyltransferase
VVTTGPVDGVGRPTLRTERLTLRPLRADDLPDLVAMNGDPEVMAYIMAPMTAAEVAAALPRWIAGEGDFGLWAGDTADGFTGIWFLSADDDGAAACETGWRLPRSAWGHGYAVEGATALLDHAFTTLGLERVWAETMAVNTRSVRVMERLGMSWVRTRLGEWEDPIPGWEQGEVVHEVTRDAWVRLRPEPGTRL